MTRKTPHAGMPHRVVVLGGGFGGAYAARTLCNLAGDPKFEVTLIDRNNFFIFTPLLVEAGIGALEPRHAVVSHRAMVPGARFIMAQVESVDVAAKTVTIALDDGAHRQTLEYDDLVIALGSQTMLPPVPGLAEHGFEMKSLPDAVALRDRAIRHLELADAVQDHALRRELLHFVVVGGSYSGVEVAGEFDVFIKEATKHYPNVKPSDVKVTLVEMTGRLLPTLDEDLADYARQTLVDRGVDVELNTTVTRVGEHEVELSDGRSIASSTCIWTAGISPPQALKGMGLPVGPKGYILCEPDLRVKDHDDIWAIGDCALNIDPGGKAYPATAQHATRMGSHVARNIQKAAWDTPTEPFKFNTLGTLAALGCRTAVAKVMGFKLSGFIAWWIWRSVYLMKMPGIGRKFRIAMHWTADLLFKRDYVQLGVHHKAELPREWTEPLADHPHPHAPDLRPEHKHAAEHEHAVV